MARDIVIDHKDIKDPNTITDVQEARFKAEGLNMHVHEVDKLVDDHDKGKRIISVKNTKYFFIPYLPWLHKKEKGGL